MNGQGSRRGEIELRCWGQEGRSELRTISKRREACQGRRRDELKDSKMKEARENKRTEGYLLRINMHFIIL